MSTFPYVDISHKKIWRPLSTGRYVDPTLFLFIYFVAGSLPSWPNCGALCELGRSRGDSPGTWPRRRGFWQAGGCVCVLPSLPRSPLFSPLLVTIRRNVVAGSMTPWVEAASPLGAPGGCRQRARGAGRQPPELPAAGRAGARRCPHAPLRCRGARVERGGGGTVEAPGPRCAPPAGPRPQPASARPSPRSRPGTAAGPFRLPHERFIFVGVAASLWLPQDLVSLLLQTCPFPSHFAGGCGDGDERKVGNQ